MAVHLSPSKLGTNVKIETLGLIWYRGTVELNFENRTNAFKGEITFGTYRCKTHLWTIRLVVDQILYFYRKNI